MECKKCKKEFEESELKNGICKECLEKSIKMPLYKKWWFWFCLVAIAIIIGFASIICVAFSYVNSGIHEVALKVQSIDSEATLYTSAGGNTVIVEIPNYTDASKSAMKNNIIQAIRTYSSNNNALSNYSTFVLVTKLNSDTAKDSILTLTVYSLPYMTENNDKSKIYYDLIQSTTKNLSSTETNNTSSTIETSSQSSTNSSTPEVSSSTTSITIGQKNALSKAKSYLNYMPFSYSGLIEQLEYEGYSKEEATYGADNVGADWNDQAAKKAKNYINTMSFSRSGLIEQLEYEGFTREQAEYGASAVGY